MDKDKKTQIKKAVCLAIGYVIVILAIIFWG